MKIKINWGTGIVIAMVLFMTFILQFLYRSFDAKNSHDLVSEDYYKDELYYQQEIDKMNNASKLEQNLILKHVKEGFLITFPKDMDATKITGTAYFQRPSSKSLDFQQEVVSLTNSKLLINHTNLVSGKWKVKIDWKYNDEEFMLKETVFY
ncbi:MAG: FixH family protein [Flavobacteriaceae bacterium]|nr:FixH family protein [Flavobacteriaceae bacterium]